MKIKRFIFTLYFLSGYFIFAQENTFTKHQNSFGLSFGLGGGTQVEEMNKKHYPQHTLRSSEKSNLSTGVFWQHQWNFTNRQGLIFGIDLDYTSFSNEVYFKNPVFFNGLVTVRERLIGSFRNGFVSLDLPLYYTFTIPTRFGDINPFIGAKFRNVVFIANSKGIGLGQTWMNQQGDTTYQGNYFFTYDMNRLEPIILPTIGLKYRKKLKNGQRLNFSLSYQLWGQKSNTAEITLKDHENMEGEWKYTYHDPEDFYQYYYTINPVLSMGQTQVVVSGDEFHIWTPPPVIKVNMSQFRIGVSYSF